MLPFHFGLKSRLFKNFFKAKQYLIKAGIGFKAYQNNFLKSYKYTWCGG